MRSLGFVGTLLALGCALASVSCARGTVPGREDGTLQVATAAATDQAVLGEGWRVLFDGHSLAGWHAGSEADWTVEDGVLRATAGEVGLLSTDEDFDDFELQVDFRAAPGTNSGVFVRSPPGCRDPSRECYEINIAPPDNPFPTGSLVGRERVEGVGESDTWRSYRILVEGDRVVVFLDGQELLDYVDPAPLPAGPLGLQFNQGRIEFRRVMVRSVSHSSATQ